MAVGNNNEMNVSYSIVSAITLSDCYKQHFTNFHVTFSLQVGSKPPPEAMWGYRGGSPTTVQAWQPCPLWEPSPTHPI